MNSPCSSVRDWSSPGVTSDTVSVVWRKAELGLEAHTHDCVWRSCVSSGRMSFTVKSLRSLWRGRRCLSSQGGAMNVFDRSMKRRQKQWASSLLDSDKYDYLRDEVRRFITVMVRLFLAGLKLCEWTSALVVFAGGEQIIRQSLWCLKVTTRLLHTL